MPSREITNINLVWYDRVQEDGQELLALTGSLKELTALQGKDKDLLFILTEQHHFSVVEYDAERGKPSKILLLPITLLKDAL